MKNKSVLRTIIMVLSSIILTSCSAKDFKAPDLKGVSVIWYPVHWFWWMIFNWFAPNYWGFINSIWSSGMPRGILWLAGALTYIFAAIIFLVLLLFLIIVAIVFTVLVAFAYVIVAIFDGIFHFTSWGGESEELNCIVRPLKSLIY